MRQQTIESHQHDQLVWVTMAPYVDKKNLPPPPQLPPLLRDIQLL